MDFNKLSGISHPGDEATVGADLSCAPPIYRPTGTPPDYFVNLQISNVLSNVGKAGGSLVHEHSEIE